MNTIATKRIMRDVEMLRKNEAELASQGIYFRHFEDNIYKIHVMIVPKPKEGDGLTSPYTHGYFAFELTFPTTFPIEPPSIAFHPQQNTCRLHPNYYQTGKVCLSVINTWGNPDWSPSTSVMALLHILEERFTEKALCFEPGLEMSETSKLQKYNETVEYGKYVTAIIPILKKRYYIYDAFQDVIQPHFREHYEYHCKRLQENLIPVHQGKTLTSPAYGVKVVADYQSILQELETLYHASTKGESSVTGR